MTALKLAYKNLIGAGLRTWLNVSVLSFAFVIIVFYNGMIDGWNRQSRTDTRNWETGVAQYWTPGFDRYDPLTFQDSHQKMSEEVTEKVRSRLLVPILLVQATAYPQGRMQGAVLRGVPADQNILKLPTEKMKVSGDVDFAIIGRRMAESSHIGPGDRLLIRWRDRNGTFDAREVEIADVFKCDFPTADRGQIYLRYEVLEKMMGTKNEATYLVAGKDSETTGILGWEYKDEAFLMADMDKIIQAKKAGGLIMEGLLLIIALIAIFDTQVLAIFRRQKEIGTYIALGMTRLQVVGIFTIEGGAHSILATILGAIYGIPLFLLLNNSGIPMKAGQSTDLPIAESIFPYYSIGLIITTIIIVVISATIVSYLPARKISRMNPTDALKGKSL